MVLDILLTIFAGLFSGIVGALSAHQFFVLFVPAKFVQRPIGGTSGKTFNRKGW